MGLWDISQTWSPFQITLTSGHKSNAVATALMMMSLIENFIPSFLNFCRKFITESTLQFTVLYA